MSAITERFLICDGCGSTWGVDNRHKGIQQHRDDSKKEGWTRGGMGTDYCEECSTLPKSMTRHGKRRI